MGLHVHSPLLPATLLAVALLAACGGESAPPKSAGASRAVYPCKAPVGGAVRMAVLEYIKQAKPKPERFLIGTGTPDALGDDGLTALQDKGPTYMYPADPALQAQVRAQLHEKGDYTTLLVRRQTATSKVGEASVSLDAVYVGGTEDGHTLSPRTYRFSCEQSGDSTVWRLTNPSAEPHA